LPDRKGRGAVNAGAIARLLLSALAGLLAMGAVGAADNPGVLNAGTAVGASGAPQDWQVSGQSLSNAAADPRILDALREISPTRIHQIIQTLVGFGTRNTLSSMQHLPRGQGIGAAADWIESQFKSESRACGGCLQVRRDTFVAGPGARLPQATRLTNIYAVLGGHDPAQAGRIVLVTGHYDSRNTDVEDPRGAAPGANDDASGVAVSLECARVLSKLRLPATLIFATVAGEEQGLYGSRHLAMLAQARHWQIEAVLDDDIVGGNRTPGARGQDYSVVRVFSEGVPVNATPAQLRLIEAAGYESDSPSRELARALVSIGHTYGERADPEQAGAAGAAAVRPVLILRRDRFLRGGDHMAFNEQGFAAVRLTEWREDFRHQHQNVRLEGGVQYGDLPQYVDVNYVSRVAALNAAALASLAAAPPPPEQVRIDTAGLTNDSTLTWRAPAGTPPATRYQVLWRATRAADWQRMLPVPPGANAGGGYRVTLRVSKDNVVFGVRAVDGAGHQSPAVVPTPSP
jgi:acetylornithine deacetylase/succinyl-diaminopimelate desuccinylase-like protein